MNVYSINQSDIVLCDTPATYAELRRYGAGETIGGHREPRAETILYDTEYEHPLFNAAAIRAQERLWSLQGVRNTWFCGSYFGNGFHEDAIAAGAAVAAALGCPL